MRINGLYHSRAIYGTNCGYEKDIPEFIVYGEETDYLLDIGDTAPLCFPCPNATKTPYYRKKIIVPIHLHF